MSPSKAALALVFTMSVFAFILGAVAGVVANTPQAEMWNNECLKRSNETCANGNVCKWSIVEDRCEGTGRMLAFAGLFVSISAFYALLLTCVHTCISEEHKIQRASIEYASEYGFVSTICAFGAAVLFLEDLSFILIGITMISVSVVLFFRFFCQIKSRLEFKVDAPDKF